MALTEGTRVIEQAVPNYGIPMKCGEAVKYGDLVGVDSNGEIFPVDSDDGEHGRLIAGADGAPGDIIPCFTEAVISGYTSGTEAAALYPSGTAGSVSETADTDADDSNEIVGYVLTETKAWLKPGVRPDSVATAE